MSCTGEWLSCDSEQFPIKIFNREALLYCGHRHNTNHGNHTGTFLHTGKGNAEGKKIISATGR